MHDASPLLIPLAPLAPLSDPLSLTWNPPCCDRIHPPWSPIACKLNSSILSPCSYTPNSKFPTPRGFSPPNIHSLGWHREPGSQDPVQLGLIICTIELSPGYVLYNMLHARGTHCRIELSPSYYILYCLLSLTFCDH
jgi:hypothetical protein